MAAFADATGKTYCLRAPYVITVNGDDQIIEDGCVAWDTRTKRITHVCPAAELPNDIRIDEFLEQHVLIPGLINCHTHVAMTLLRGFADDLELMDWLDHYIWPAEKRYRVAGLRLLASLVFCPLESRSLASVAVLFLSKEYITLGTQMGVYEMLKTGTTCFLDMYFMPADTVAVTVPAGIRCFNGHAIIDFGDGSVDGLIDVARDYVNSAPTSLVTPVICPHSCYTVPKEKLQKLADAVSSRGDDAPVLTHIHLHESTGEIASYYEKSGESAIETLKSVGLLNRNMIAAHCVHLTEDEISTLATAGVNAAHCPRSNLKLASGMSPVQRLLDAGINVCLGTDSACSNNSLCMLQEMQFASLVGKLSSGSDARSVNCHTALRMATMNGAKALGKDKDLGSLEVGKIADIVAVDLGHIGSLPVYDPVSALVYTNERTVSDVWIDGKRVVKSSQVLTMARPNVNQMEQFRRRLIKFKKEECGPRARHARGPAEWNGSGWSWSASCLRGGEDADVTLAAAASNELPPNR
ncbi:hypothetical protein FOZ60_008989 [Perkinsus olseni]|uniref:Amidohydrolase-related domain-containing protein n=1 Tax=Perkinsus olseni TaxID=32597 RepID=A0A7J6PEM2_PEROL|nr:hypothetical protein FOZ60_008989 [Perkinsus olseni]